MLRCFPQSLLCLSILLWFVPTSQQVRADLIYSGPTDVDHPIDPAIPSTDSRFLEWANSIDTSLTQFSNRGSVTVDQTGGFNSLGDLDASEIAAGNTPGYLTVTFPTGISNGAGADFAVFENGFMFGSNSDGVSGLFAEFAYVDVSTDGSNFARFPSISLNAGPLSGSGAFASYDVTNVYNLAGKHANGFGTPFDLDDLAADPLVASGSLDLNNVQYVRLFDIPGNGAFQDSLGNPIYDNWLTQGSGGFDFRLGEGVGVGVFNVSAVPEPSAFALSIIACISVASRRHRRSKMT